jgi:hypothetical protein
MTRKAIKIVSTTHPISVDCLKILKITSLVLPLCFCFLRSLYGQKHKTKHVFDFIILSFHFPLARFGKFDICRIQGLYWLYFQRVFYQNRQFYSALDCYDFPHSAYDWVYTVLYQSDCEVFFSSEKRSNPPS